MSVRLHCQEIVLFFSEGIFILAGIIFGGIEYTAVFIIISVSSSVVTIAETVFFDVDHVDIGTTRVVDYFDA